MRRLAQNPQLRELFLPWDEICVSPRPDGLDHLAKGSRNLSLHSQGVVLVDILDVVVVGEVLGDRGAVGQTLLIKLDSSKFVLAIPTLLNLMKSRSKFV